MEVLIICNLQTLIGDVKEVPAVLLYYSLGRMDFIKKNKKTV